MDRNTVTGFALLAVLLVTYIAYNNYSQKEFEKKKLADSIAYAKAHPVAPIDSSRLKSAAVAGLADTLADSAKAALPPALRSGNAQTVQLENKDIALQFSTHGAFPISATLKEYKNYNGGPLHFFNGTGNVLAAIVPAGTAQASTADLTFAAQQQGPRKVTFAADLGTGRRIDLTDSLPTEGYMVQCDVRLTGMTVSSLPIRWHARALHTEQSVKTERTNAQIHH
jgi:YidC/Oxa1 family membrane protein insertase